MNIKVACPLYFIIVGVGVGVVGYGGALGAGPSRGGAETFGAEANPTGEPIGGGVGYGRRVGRSDFSVGTARELIAALSKAKAGQVVAVADAAEIDLTAAVRGRKGVWAIPAGVTLSGGRGRKGSPGGLIFSDEMKTSPLFRIGGAGVRLTGLRLRGPDGEIREKELRRRIREGTYYGLPTSAGVHCDRARLEVDNCELSCWSHAGVYLRKGGTAARVHHNHIHHCQRLGLGYGVCLNATDGLVEANRFDHCRHHIAGTGRPGTSYEARWNLVGLGANGHSFDMHGGRDRKDSTDVAGTEIHIHHNTFRATNVPAIVIRGRPERLARIHHNWFLHTSLARAVRQTNTTGNVQVSDNRFGPKARPASAEK